MLNSEIDLKIPPTRNAVTEAIISMAISWIGRGHILEFLMYEEKEVHFFIVATGDVNFESFQIPAHIFAAYHLHAGISRFLK
jgi:hypothetical protein